MVSSSIVVFFASGMSLEHNEESSSKLKKAEETNMFTKKWLEKKRKTKKLERKYKQKNELPTSGFKEYPN